VAAIAVPITYLLESAFVVFTVCLGHRYPRKP
jgi:hypothetical protein